MLTGIVNRLPTITPTYYYTYLISINTSDINNTNANITLLPIEFLGYTDRESLELDTEAIMTTLISGLNSVVHIISMIMWTRIQYKVVSHLTAALSRARCNLTHNNRGQDVSSDGQSKDTSQNEFKLGFLWLLHMSMYIGYLKYDQAPGSPEGKAILIISSIPLALPYSFYSTWPTLSKIILMLWGHLWLHDVLAWLISTLYAFLDTPSLRFW